MELTNSLIIESSKRRSISCPDDAVKSIRSVKNIQWDRENFFLVMLDDCFNLIGIELLDHIIINEKTDYSFKANGYI